MKHYQIKHVEYAVSYLLFLFDNTLFNYWHLEKVVIFGGINWNKIQREVVELKVQGLSKIHCLLKTQWPHHRWQPGWEPSPSRRHLVNQRYHPLYNSQSKHLVASAWIPLEWPPGQQELVSCSIRIPMFSVVVLEQQWVTVPHQDRQSGWTQGCRIR